MYLRGGELCVQQGDGFGSGLLWRGAERNGLGWLRHHRDPGAADALVAPEGSAEHRVAVPAGRGEQPVQKFGSFTKDLHRVAAWLSPVRDRHGRDPGHRRHRMALYQFREEPVLQVNVVNAGRRSWYYPGGQTGG